MQDSYQLCIKAALHRYMPKGLSSTLNLKHSMEECQTLQRYMGVDIEATSMNKYRDAG